MVSGLVLIGRGSSHNVVSGERVPSSMMVSL